MISEKVQTIAKIVKQKNIVSREIVSSDSRISSYSGAISIILNNNISSGERA